MYLLYLIQFKPCKYRKGGGAKRCGCSVPTPMSWCPTPPPPPPIVDVAGGHQCGPIDVGCSTSRCQHGGGQHGGVDMGVDLPVSAWPGRGGGCTMWTWRGGMSTQGCLVVSTWGRRHGLVELADVGVANVGGLTWLS